MKIDFVDNDARSRSETPNYKTQSASGDADAGMLGFD
jgi:hypothetical protein